ncbi:unnamed protein product [Soboliphyme baturini]|uniref:FYVE-type domain-containing protein n=1 Tax=Soboliphyme baturini TaxID=241478 RepID=A0A183J1S6_9BILA|nr:unnamed protein product [Soboliphyme baturini]
MNEEKFESFSEYEALAADTARLNRVTRFFVNLFSRDMPNDSPLAGSKEEVTDDKAVPADDSLMPTMSDPVTDRLPVRQEAQQLAVHSLDPEPPDHRRTRRLQDYERSDFRQCWMPDARGKECYECQDKFSTFRRRHHCRICGQIFCARCCKKEVPGRLLGYGGVLRLCDYCYEVVLRYLKTSLCKRLNSPQQDASGSPTFSEMTIAFLSRLTDSSTSQGSNHCFSDEKQGDEFAADTRPRELWKTPTMQRLPASGGGSANRLRNIIETTAAIRGDGEDDSDGPVSLTLGNDTERASDTCAGEELEPEWLRGISAERTCDKNEFADEPSAKTDSSSDSMPFSRLKTYSLSLNLDSVNLKVDSCSESALALSPVLDAPQNDMAIAAFWSSFSAPCTPISVNEKLRRSSASSSSDGLSVDAISDASLHSMFMQHAEQLLKYVLLREHLEPEVWTAVVWPLAKEIAFTVKPDPQSRKDDMNILRYVHVKTLKTSEKPSAQIVFGTACSKSLVDKHMRSTFRLPKILVLRGQIEYERVSGKLTSIDPVIMQEAEYVKNLVRRILSHKPDIVLVEKSVSFTALKYLREAGVSVVHNLKATVLQRIARCTNAQLVESIEGPCKWKLFKIKRVFKFMLCALYSAKLEIVSLSRYAYVGEDRADHGVEPCDVCDSNRSLAMNAAFDGQHRIVLSNSPFLSFVRSYAEQLSYLPGRPVSGKFEAKVRDSELDSCCESDYASSKVAPNRRYHDFTFKTLTDDISSESMQHDVANYRAFQGRIFRSNVSAELLRAAEEMERDAHRRKLRRTVAKRVDRLHPFFHQRIALLHCSFSSKSENAPGFCLRPRVFVMDFYGRSDVTLGHYLERFCFSPSFNCPRENCCAKMVYLVQTQLTFCVKSDIYTMVQKYSFIRSFIQSVFLSFTNIRVFSYVREPHRKFRPFFHYFHP